MLTTTLAGLTCTTELCHILRHCWPVEVLGQSLVRFLPAQVTSQWDRVCKSENLLTTLLWEYELLNVSLFILLC